MAHLDRGPRFQGEGCYGSIPVFFTWAAAAGVTRHEADASENTEIVSALVRVYPSHICPTGSTLAAIHFFKKKKKKHTQSSGGVVRGTVREDLVGVCTLLRVLPHMVVLPGPFPAQAGSTMVLASRAW